MRRLTQQEFESKARCIHGDKYDYSVSEYTSHRAMIAIRCKLHNYIFYQKANSHLAGSGCPVCGRIGRRAGDNYVGFYDSSEPQNSTKCGRVWRGMLDRCYNNHIQQIYPSYTGCKVCEEWLTYSNFKRWFDENYIEGYQLDKDILSDEEKIYSPNTCCFVPQEINKLILMNNRGGSDLPPGVVKRGLKYEAMLGINGTRKHLGYSDTIDGAYNLYKKAKSERIASVATKYYRENKISERVYLGLINKAKELLQ